MYDYIGQAANETLHDAVFFDAGVNASSPSVLDGTFPVGFDPGAYQVGQVTSGFVARVQSNPSAVPPIARIDTRSRIWACI